jgi:hypothetical protein
MFIKASRKLDHYLLKPTLEKLLNRGNATFSGLDFCALGKADSNPLDIFVDYQEGTQSDRW